MTPTPPLADAAKGFIQRVTESQATRRILALGFAVAMGLMGVALAHQWRQRQFQALEQQRKELVALYHPPVPVLAATRDLAAGATVGPADVTTIPVPQKFIQPYAAKAANEVVGLVAAAPIAEGEQLMTNKLRRPEVVSQGATLSTLTPKGKRAVTIAVDTISGVGGFVRPGDRVDVLWTVNLGPGKVAEGGATITLFQDVPVLAVGSELGQPEGAKRGERGERQSPAMLGGSQFTVTLAMSPQDTSFLLFAREQGKIQLTLRPKQEAGTAPVPPANIQTLLESQLGIKAAPPPGVMRQVEVYKGLKRDVVALAEEAAPASPQE